jgi:hypothetical protein
VGGWRACPSHIWVLDACKEPRASGSVGSTSAPTTRNHLGPIGEGIHKDTNDACTATGSLPAVPARNRTRRSTWGGAPTDAASLARHLPTCGLALTEGRLHHTLLLAPDLPHAALLPRYGSHSSVMMVMMTLKVVLCVCCDERGLGVLGAPIL